MSSHTTRRSRLGFVFFGLFLSAISLTLHFTWNSSLSPQLTSFRSFHNEEVSTTPVTIEGDNKRNSSSSSLDLIRSVERSHNVSSRCSKFGGVEFMQSLVDSSRPILVPGKGESEISSFVNNEMDIYVARNVALDYDVTYFGDKVDPAPSFRLIVNGKVNDPEKRLAGRGESETVLRTMTKDLVSTRSKIECEEFVEHPVMLVDDNVNHWNWWFFLIELLKHFVEHAVAEPLLSDGGGSAVQVLQSAQDVHIRRPFTKAFEYLFSGQRYDSVQVWNLQEGGKRKGRGSDAKLKGRICFREVVWSPESEMGGILINRRHPNADCFSSIVYAFSTVLKASLGISSLPKPKNPRVVWVGRDMSSKANPTEWQRKRIIKNQPEVIQYLTGRCREMGVELIVADFYGKKKETPFLKQAQLVSKANIMVGIHGAGLNMFMLMPFGSVVVEIHMGTNGNKNSVNTVNHLGGGAYLTLNGRRKTKSRSDLDPEPVWGKLREAIDIWQRL